tara:strand:- start:3233 stop:3925 length:693 start_codon:yes stop_codon:yes gene_type:complete
VSSKGFSLLELLVVLAVMGVMMGVLGFSFLGNSSSDLGDAQRNLISYLNKAKATSVSSGSEARIIVAAESDNEEKYLRHLQTILLDRNNSGQWLIVDNGISLPKNVWFVTDGIDGENSDWPQDGECIWSSSDQDEEFRLALSRSKNGEKKVFEESAEGEKYHFLKCMPNGKFSSASYPQMPKLVFAKGKLIPTQTGEIIPNLSDRNQIAGIQMQPLGGIFSLSSQDFSND